MMFVSPVFHGLGEIVDPLPLQQPRHQELPLVPDLQEDISGTTTERYMVHDNRQNKSSRGLCIGVPGVRL